MEHNLIQINSARCCGAVIGMTPHELKSIILIGVVTPVGHDPGVMVEPGLA